MSTARCRPTGAVVGIWALLSVGSLGLVLGWGGPSTGGLARSSVPVATSPATASAQQADPADEADPPGVPAPDEQRSRWVSAGTPVGAASWIAFSSRSDDRLYVIAPNGSGLHVVAADGAGTRERAWLPDGKGLAFCSDELGALAVLPCLPYRGVPWVRSTTSPTTVDATAQLSPDGRTAAFVRVRGSAGRTGLLVHSVVSGRASELVVGQWSIDPHVDWDPSGNWLVYASSPEPGRPADLWTIRSDGSDLRRLTELAPGQSASSPTFSPDGRSVAFVRSGDGPAELVTARADGADAVVILRHPGIVPRNLDWGPVVE